MTTFGKHEVADAHNELGERYLKEFPNGYSASIVRNEYSYGGKEGLYEVAVKRGDEIAYDTPVTDDVIGHLYEEQVAIVLDEIAALTKEGTDEDLA